MKKLILICSFLISSATLADSSMINKERMLMCDAVQKLFEQRSGVHLDHRRCLKNKTIRSVFVSEDVRGIDGDLLFHSPEGASFELNCELDYVGSPEIENIMGGVEVGVYCS